MNRNLYRVYFGTTYAVVAANNITEAIKHGKASRRGLALTAKARRNSDYMAVTKVEKLLPGKEVELKLPLSEELSTIVIFRKWKGENVIDGRNGDIIALFPEVPSSCQDYYHCQSYMHVGQHGAADPWAVIQTTAPAKESEYKPLLQELRRIGYRKLFVRHRQTQAMLRTREKEWRKLMAV